MKEQLRNLVAAMGNTADSIAEFLRARGVKGKPSKSMSCPIANYLADATGSSYANVKSTIGVGEDVIESPPAVCDFVAKFDSGRYPDLIEGN